MSEDKKEDSIKKLGREFSAFHVEWKRFLTNDLPHMTADIASLKADVGSLNKNVGSSAGHIAFLVDEQKATEKSIRVIDQNVLELLKRMK